MRKTIVLILCSLIICLVAPLHVVTADSSQNDTTVIFTLDVCGSAGSYLSASPDMPSICQCPCNIVPLEFISYLSVSKPFFLTLLISSQDERPPKV